MTTRARYAVAALAATLLATPAGPLAAPASASVDRSDTGSSSSGRADPVDPVERKRQPVEFRIASLNQPHTMGAGSVRHDVRLVLRRGKPSVIGFQERGGSRPAMRRALPRHWGLVMPPASTGAGLNPVAYDQRIWKLKESWAKLLAARTWRRGGAGKMAIAQHGVVVRLEHRRTGHTIRLINFHMPPDVHDKRTGGPNWRNAARVRAFWRMAANVREVARGAGGDQFVATCDCNVKESRDTGRKLVKGRISGPLGLTTNYDRGPAPVPFEADYVMAEQEEGFPLVDWRQLNAGLITDHPSPVATFRESGKHLRQRTS